MRWFTGPFVATERRTGRVQDVIQPKLNYAKTEPHDQKKLEVYKRMKTSEVKELELKMSNELPGIVKVKLAKNLDGHRFEKS